jgi:hypothetical protein
MTVIVGDDGTVTVHDLVLSASPVHVADRRFDAGLLA